MALSGYLWNTTYRVEKDSSWYVLRGSQTRRKALLALPYLPWSNQRLLLTPLTNCIFSQMTIFQCTCIIPTCLIFKHSKLDDLWDFNHKFILTNQLETTALNKSLAHRSILHLTSCDLLTFRWAIKCGSH